MREIKLEKRFPNVSTEDFCEIFSNGLLTGLKVAGKNAIPIEWILKWACEFCNPTSEGYKMAMELIHDWRKEYEIKE